MIGFGFRNIFSLASFSACRSFRISSKYKVKLDTCFEGSPLLESTFLHVFGGLSVGELPALFLQRIHLASMPEGLLLLQVRTVTKVPFRGIFDARTRTPLKAPHEVLHEVLYQLLRDRHESHSTRLTTYESRTFTATLISWQTGFTCTGFANAEASGLT